MSTALPSSLSEMQPPLPAALIGLMMLGVRTARLAWAQLYLRVTQVGGRQLSKEGFASWIHPRKKKKSICVKGFHIIPATHREKQGIES